MIKYFFTRRSNTDGLKNQTKHAWNKTHSRKSWCVLNCEKMRTNRGKNWERKKNAYSKETFIALTQCQRMVYLMCFSSAFSRADVGDFHYFHCNFSLEKNFLISRHAFVWYSLKIRKIFSPSLCRCTMLLFLIVKTSALFRFFALVFSLLHITLW